MKKLPNTRQLQYLLALHHYQHFGHAAESCSISQSTLSAAILNLEETMDAQLLERDHKTFIFTPLGEEVVRQSRELIQHLDELTDYVKDQGKPMTGIMRLGCIPTIAPFVLSDLLMLTRKNYPELQLLLREDTTDNLLRALKEGEIDIVLLALPYQTQGLHTQVLTKDPFKLVLHKTWQEKGFDKALRTWPDESIFLLEQEHCLTNHALEACKLQENRKINPFHATTLHTLTQMVNSQLGVTFLPQIAINSGILQGTDLVAKEPKAKQAYREIGIAWRPTSYRQQRYQLLSQAIKHVLTSRLDLGQPTC
jgi:LysR family transcriptional regulator, hydrogen peroxide-inducible genes activator